MFSLFSYQSLEVQPYHPARLARLVGGNSTEITDELIDVAINMMRTFCIHEEAPYICYYTPVQLEYFCSAIVEIDTEFHVQTIPVDKSSVNIHHLPGHWVTSYYNCETGNIHIYDSLICQTHFNEVQKQLLIMYEKILVKNVIYEHVTQQSTDPICGLMAIAFAYTCLISKNPTQISYDITKVRHHFQQCLLNGQLSEFPTLTSSTTNCLLQNYFSYQLERTVEMSDLSETTAKLDAQRKRKADYRAQKKQKLTYDEIGAKNKSERIRVADHRAQKKKKQTEDGKAAENLSERKRRADGRAQKKKKLTENEIAIGNELERKRKADARFQKKTKQTEDEIAAENELDRKRKADERGQK